MSEERRTLAQIVEQRPASERVVVTGMGIVSSLGPTVESFWQGILAGRSGISRITSFDVSEFPTTISGWIPDFETPPFVPRKEARHIARFALMGLHAAHAALEEAGLGHALESDRAGVLVGTAVGGLDETERTVRALIEKGPMRISPFYIVMAPANLAAFHIAQRFRLLGYNNSVVTACAAGTQAIGEAAEVIRRGAADIMVAGGCEAGLSPIALASFCVGNAFSTRNDPPEAASRPFDKDRDGFVGGEGSGMVVLERLDHALARGAVVRGEVLGYGASNDAYHLIAPDPEGAGAARAMRAALLRAGVTTAEVDYINAHATGTPLGDVSETKAIKAVFGSRAYDIPVSATKSMIGHLFGAAGAVEAITTLLALRDGVIPPTINLDSPDPECDLDYVPHVARRAAIDIALSNSFGLGGQDAVVVLARHDDR